MTTLTPENIEKAQVAIQLFFSRRDTDVYTALRELTAQIKKSVENGWSMNNYLGFVRDRDIPDISEEGRVFKGDPDIFQVLVNFPNQCIPIGSLYTVMIGKADKGSITLYGCGAIGHC